jgi:hypothetical protein
MSLRLAAIIALEELERLRSKPRLTRETLDAEIERIRTEVAAYGCQLIAHRSNTGPHRFLIREQAGGRAYDLITHFFHHEALQQNMSSMGSGAAKKFRRGKKTPALVYSLAAVVALTLPATLSLSGCATSNDSAAGKRREATICPQCKMVAVTPPQPVGPGLRYGPGFSGFGPKYRWGGLGTAFGWATGPFGYATAYEDTCPGCKGALKTFFTEGKWNHKCSVCQQKPFTCPVSHPF